jgi:xanthine dehydrogenase accessory factor
MADNDLNRQITQVVLAAVNGGEVVATATVVSAPADATVPLGSKMLVRADGETISSLGDGDLRNAIVEECRDAIRQHLITTRHFTPDGQRLEHLSRAAITAQSYYSILIETFEPPATLLIVGGGHIGKSLAELGAMMGFSIAVADDRQEYCNPERFPEADHLLCGDLVEMLRGFRITSNTFVVLVSRGHKQDELSLREVVRSPARYVGMIGSKRRVTAVLQHLIAEGAPAEAVERVHTPIGLDIGAETPEEIAVSIMAEIILERRGGSGAQMSRLARVTERVTSNAPAETI